MKLVGRQVNIERLRAELQAAGVSVAALGIDGDNLHTYDEQGRPAELPPAALAVVQAHVPPPPLAPPDYGPEDEADRTGGQLAQAVAALRQYLELAAPTQAQTAGALRLVIRLVLLLARRSLRAGAEG